MIYWFSIIFFILGAAIGSFLSVVIGRWGTGEGAVKGRSRCSHCKKTIAPRDLVPIFSFLALKARCRYCKKKISPTYLLLEIGLGLLFLLFYWRFADLGVSLNSIIFFVLYLYFIVSLAIVLVIDAKSYIIPDAVIIPASVIGIILAVIDIAFAKSGLDFLAYAPMASLLFWGLVIGGGFFLALVVVSREKWMGWGDVKLGALMGILLGYPLIIIALFGSFIIGGAYGAMLILMGKKSRKDIIPFGPFLVIGAFIALFLGKYIIRWYLG